MTNPCSYLALPRTPITYLTIVFQFFSKNFRAAFASGNGGHPQHRCLRNHLRSQASASASRPYYLQSCWPACSPTQPSLQRKSRWRKSRQSYHHCMDVAASNVSGHILRMSRRVPRPGSEAPGQLTRAVSNHRVH